MGEPAAISDGPARAGVHRILVVSAGVPHESDGASVVIFYHYVARILRDGHHIRHLLLLEASTASDQAVDAYRQKIAPLGAAEVAVVRSPRAMQATLTGLRLDPAAADRAQQLGRDFAPDAILAFDLAAAWLVKAVAAPRRVIWLGDLTYQAMYWHARYGIHDDPIRILRAPRDLYAACLWRRAYKDILRGADQVVVSSASSVAEMARLGIAADYEPYPWPAQATARENRPDAVPTFLFFGTIEGLGSKSAIHVLAEKIYPRLRKVWGAGGFRILIGGRGERPVWFMRLMAGKPELDWIGFVPDLDEVFCHCHGILTPIEVPVGNRSRILTALAKRALVIAHANVARGNPALIHGETCALARTPEQFVAQMRRAVDDRAWAAAIAERGQQCYADLFAPERAAPRLVHRLFA